jgi:hypothetical protein
MATRPVLPPRHGEGQGHSPLPYGRGLPTEIQTSSDRAITPLGASWPLL